MDILFLFVRFIGVGVLSLCSEGKKVLLMGSSMYKAGELDPRRSYRKFYPYWRHG